MATIELSKYRNLANWTQDEWEKLDIYTFIAANYNRYCSSLLKKIGTQYLPSDAKDVLMGLFADVSYKPLKNVHKKNITARGECRNQALLGTLKKIAVTRMIDAVIKEFPNTISIDRITVAFTLDEHADVYETDHRHIPSTQSQATELSTVLYAASSAEDLLLDTEKDLDSADNETSRKVEIVRSHLTKTQYKHLRYVVCDGLSFREIAEHTDHSITNVRIILLNTRKKMLGLVPHHLQKGIESCLFRN